MNFNWKKLGILAGLSLSLVVAGCGQDDSASKAGITVEMRTTTNISKELDYTITGIEPGAGITGKSNQYIRRI